MAYTPASNLTSTASLAHLATVFYQRTALDQLKKRFRFNAVCEPDQIPLRSGKTCQWYRYSLFAANTTPAPEGTVGTGLPLTTTTVSASVSEYGDYLTISTLLSETAIDPIVTNASEQLAYRAGLTVDTLARTEFDANVATVGLTTVGATLAVADFRRSIALLAGADVLPRAGGNFMGIIHPYAVYDLKSDNTAGGFIDVMRYANAQVFLKDSFTYEGEAGMVEGTRLLTSTNVGTSGTAPNVLYYTYIVGKGAVGSVDLAGSGPTKVENPDAQQFKVNVIRGGPQIADPMGMIGAAVSYRFVDVFKTLDSTNYRYKIVKADASLV